MPAVLGEHRSFAIKSMASPAWSRAATARAEMLFLGCHGTRRVKVVSDGINGNSALGREGGSQRSVFTIVCQCVWCRNTTSPSGIQGATDVIGGLEKCRTERNVKGSGCLAPRSGQDCGLAAAIALLVVDQTPGWSSRAFPAPWSCSSSCCSGSRSPSFPADSPGGDAHPLACLPSLPFGAEGATWQHGGISVAAVCGGVRGAGEALGRALADGSPGSAGLVQGAAQGRHQAGSESGLAPAGDKTRGRAGAERSCV